MGAFSIKVVVAATKVGEMASERGREVGNKSLRNLHLRGQTKGEKGKE